MSEPVAPRSDGPAPRKLAASFFLGVAGIGLVFVLALRGLLRPLLPVLLVVALVLVLRRIIKAIRAPVD